MRFNLKTQLFPFACEVLVSGVCFFEHQMFFAFIKSDVFCGLHLLDYKRLLACLNVRLNVFVGAQSCGMYLDDASLLCVMPKFGLV